MKLDEERIRDEEERAGHFIITTRELNMPDSITIKNIQKEKHYRAFF